MRLDHKFKGFNEFEKLLKELPRNVENKVLQTAVTGTLREIKPEMKAAAPRHMDEQSPASKKFGSTRQNIRVFRLKRVPKGQKAARIDTGNAFWSLIYELGSRFQPARPWFAPTFRKCQERMLDILGRKIGEGIEKEAGKYRGGR